MLVKAVCFVITNKCTAACDICCHQCGPSGREVMRGELLLQTLDGLKAVGGIKVVGFSGGEPFLFPALLEKGIRRAQQLGFSTTVATNGFWGAWPEEKIQALFETFKPNHMSFSTDESHREYVPDETLGRAIGVARVLKIPFDLCIGENRRGLSAGEYFKTLGDYKYLSKFSVYPHVPAGRARAFPGDSFFRYVPLSSAVCTANGEISIRYNGDVFPCCSPFVHEMGLSLGNVNKQDIGAILSAAAKNPMLAVIQRKGFGGLVKAAREQYGMEFSDPCTNVCEVCSALFCDAARREELEPVLEEEYGRYITEKLVGKI